MRTKITWGSNGFAQLGHAPDTNGDSTCGIDAGICNPTPAPLLDQVWRF